MMSWLLSSPAAKTWWRVHFPVKVDALRMMRRIAEGLRMDSGGASVLGTLTVIPNWLPEFQADAIALNLHLHRGQAVSGSI
jgi:hypothetical protein